MKIDEFHSVLCLFSVSPPAFWNKYRTTPSNGGNLASVSIKVSSFYLVDFWSCQFNGFCCWMFVWPAAFLTICYSNS